MDESHLNLTGRSDERPVSFPDAILVRGRAGDGADCLVTFDRRMLMMSRPIAGLACRIRVPVRQYLAVAVLARDEGHVVRLLHDESGLSVDVEAFSSFETAEEYRDRLATFLDLPQLTLAGAPADKAKVDREAASFQARHPSLRKRRARFLTRRQSGTPLSLRKIEGCEIIARN
jgi:hypothetical protein